MLDKELLQILIGIVNAQLLKTDKDKKENYETERANKMERQIQKQLSMEQSP